MGRRHPSLRRAAPALSAAHPAAGMGGPVMPWPRDAVALQQEAGMQHGTLAQQLAEGQRLQLGWGEGAGAAQAPTGLGWVGLDGVELRPPRPGHPSSSRGRRVRTCPSTGALAPPQPVEGGCVQRPEDPALWALAHPHADSPRGVTPPSPGPLSIEEALRWGVTGGSLWDSWCSGVT